MITGDTTRAAHMHTTAGAKTRRIGRCDGAQCVDVEPLPDGRYALTDSKTPNSPALIFDAAELDRFAQAWTAGEFAPEATR